MAYKETSPASNLPSTYDAVDVGATHCRQMTSPVTQPVVGRDVTGMEDDVTEDEDAEMAPPDGGWGWFIVVGAGINSMLQGLMVQTFGLLYLQFRARYNASAVDAVWPCALNQLLQGLLGPLAAWLVQRYSSRCVTILGTILIVVGILSTAFTPSLGVLYITYGVLPGIGFCLTHTASFLHVGKYFVRRKARALALTSVNHGIGALVFAPVVVLLEKEYDFRGMFIILSAIFLHLFISAALYRPLVRPKQSNSKLVKSSLPPSTIWRPRRKDTAKLYCGKPEKSLEPLCGNDREQPDLITKMTLSGEVAENQNIMEMHCSQCEKNDNSKVYVNGDMVTHTQHSNGHIPNDTVFQPGTGLSPVVINSTEVSPGHELQKEITHHSSNDKKKGFIQMFTTVIVRQEYNFLCLSVLSMFTATATATSFVPAYALEVGLSMTQAASLVSVMGIFFAVGTLLLGSLLDIPTLRPYRLYLYTGCFFIGGLAVMSLPLFSSFIGLCFPVAVAAAAMAVIYSQLLTVLTDMLGQSNVAAGFGIVRIAGSFGALTGRMVGGVLVDAIGSNSLPFLVFGALPTTSSILLALSLIHRKRKARLLLKQTPKEVDMPGV